MQWAKKQTGFTIVELLIVIVIIAILAAITIVGYNGIQNRAKASALQSAAAQSTKKVLAHAVVNSDEYPADLTEVGISDSEGMQYQYTSNNTVTPRTYCLTVTNDALSYYTSNTSQSPQAGICPGHNLLVWNKTTALATTPILNTTPDTSVFRTATASMRIPPATPQANLRGSPFSGTAGQLYTVTLWVLTDSNWNGSSGSSKIRIANAADNTQLASCTYNGVKTTWTQVTCSYRLTASITSIAIRVGNDGNTGNIWIDDFKLTKTD